MRCAEVRRELQRRGVGRLILLVARRGIAGGRRFGRAPDRDERGRCEEKSGEDVNRGTNETHAACVARCEPNLRLRTLRKDPLRSPHLRGLCGDHAAVPIRGGSRATQGD